jgi:hypothetical protein
MDIKEYLESLGIEDEGSYEEDSYIINMDNSKDYGRIFTILDTSEDIDIIPSNQLVTDQGSSLMYESISEPLLLNLLADFEGGVYQLVVNELEG